jgi:hypothetical protein
MQALSPPLSRALSDPADEALSAEGPQLAELAKNAWSLSRAPRIALLVRIDDLGRHADDAPVQAGVFGPGRAPPAAAWMPLDLARPGFVERTPHALRVVDDTAYASPALGWPTCRRVSELADTQPVLGEERALRNEEAWAGRTRSIAWPAMAWNREGSDGETAQPCFVAIGQRTALRRAMASGFRAPPDRLATLAPPRARVPTAQVLADVFANARVPLVSPSPAVDGAAVPPPPPPVSDDAERTRLAPMLPGPLQILTTGQRPGALLTSFEAVTLGWAQSPFDMSSPIFGRPAARGPVIARQVRAPRSSALPDGGMNLALRRQTFVAGDETDAKGFRRFKLFDAPAFVARYDTAADAPMPRSISFKVVSPVAGWLSSAWDGTLQLNATVPGGGAAQIALARIGLLPVDSQNTSSCKPYVLLRIGNQAVVYESMAWQPVTADPPPDRETVLQLTFSFTAATARNVLAVAMRDLQADTAIRFTIRCGQPLPNGAPDPNPDSASDPKRPLALATDSQSGPADEDLLPGPPASLVFDLAGIPPRRRWLPLAPLTLCFADPSYDRELGSPVTSRRVLIDNVPYTLAVDRADYDLGATIYLAFWKNDGEAFGNTVWQLSVKVSPGDGSAERFLGIAGTNSMTSRYRILGGSRVYAIPIQNLLELLDQSDAMSSQPARLQPGDRLHLAVVSEARSLDVDVGIVANPVLPPAGASYGLATLPGGGTVRTALFATAPLPQVIDFPNLFGDLKVGHVRRRGLFFWRFVCLDAPTDASRFAFLVKMDRTGGGQTPDSEADCAGFSK